MKELINGLYAIAVPKKSGFYSVLSDILSYDPNMDAEHGTWEHSALSETSFDKFEIVGIWEDGKADFDVAEYVEVYEKPSSSRKYYIAYRDGKEWQCDTKDEAFTSLILSKGFKESDKLVIIRKK